MAVSVKQLNDATAITAGGPMSNCKLYILDNWGNPLPIGIYGNLYVGGMCVGRGYRGAAQLTSESFTDSPFQCFSYRNFSGSSTPKSTAR